MEFYDAGIGFLQTKQELKTKLLSGASIMDCFLFSPGQDCEIIKAETWRQDDKILYFPDHTVHNIAIHRSLTVEEIEDALELFHTGWDFVDLCDGNEEKAKLLFEAVDWQTPGALYGEGFLDEEEEE